jgi:hypothetical protein
VKGLDRKGHYSADRHSKLYVIENGEPLVAGGDRCDGCQLSLYKLSER